MSGWCATQSTFTGSNHCEIYIQLDLRIAKDIRSVRIRKYSNTTYVSTFKVKFSTDGKVWNFYQRNDTNPEEYEFSGSSSSIDEVTVSIQPTTARYVRFCPQTWQGSAPSMRVGLVGCSNVPKSYTTLTAGSSWSAVTNLRAVLDDDQRTCLGGRVSLQSTTAQIVDPEPKILDSENADNVTVVVSGAWSVADYLPHNGKSYLYTHGSGNNVTFYPKVSVTGSYNVELFFSNYSNRASAVSVQVGSSTVSVDQTGSGNAFMSIGTFSLTPIQSIVINGNSDKSKFVVADAVRVSLIPNSEITTLPTNIRPRHDVLQPVACFVNNAPGTCAIQISRTTGIVKLVMDDSGILTAGVGNWVALDGVCFGGYDNAVTIGLSSTQAMVNLLGASSIALG